MKWLHSLIRAIPLAVLLLYACTPMQAGLSPTPTEIAEGLKRTVEERQPELAQIGEVYQKLSVIEQVGIQMLFGEMITQEEFMAVAIPHGVATIYIQKAEIALIENDLEKFKEYRLAADQIAHDTLKILEGYLEKKKPAAGNPDYRHPERRQAI